jgi:phosphoribosylaminoimidazole-succinocarboxamide synthase
MFRLDVNLIQLKLKWLLEVILSGHSERVYKSGKRSICGVKLENGLVSNQKFNKPIITPSTKADVGHDEDISKADIIDQKILSTDQYEEIEHITHRLFLRGTEIAKERGLLLVDTKYEFGYDNNNKLYLIDEIHTPDSSRFFYKDSYNKSIENGVAPKQLSKEFFRQWLIENNFQGKENQSLPKITDEIVKDVSNRYIELYNKILGLEFDKSNNTNSINQIEENIIKGLKTL